MLLLLGFAVGLALGLTGAGGAIIAVPLLMAALHLPAQDAMGVSLGAVSAAAMVGSLSRRERCPPLWPVALGLAITGMAFAPLGRWLAYRIDEQTVLILFAGLAAALALRMWHSVDLISEPGKVGCAEPPGPELPWGTLAVAGAGLGVLSGFFGVGGGFLVIPFLTLYLRLPIERAISTSLLVIALVGISGYTYHVFSTRMDDVAMLSLIAVGSIVGILVGSAIGLRMPARALQRGFAVFILLVSAWMLWRGWTQG